MNIKQLLNESFETYKTHFNKLLLLILPIITLGFIAEFYVYKFTDMIDENNFGNMTLLVFNIIIYVLSILAVALFFSPAVDRTIQKNEDNNVFDSVKAYDFQRRNIFKWIMVNVWGVIYMINVIRYYIIVAFVLTLLSILFKNPLIIVVVTSLSIFVIITGSLLNISKFILHKNIFFSKDEISARDAVLESMNYGKTKNKEVWGLILSLIMFLIGMIALYLIMILILGFLGMSKDTFEYVNIVITNIGSALFIFPITSIILAKGYCRIRG